MTVRSPLRLVIAFALVLATLGGCAGTPSWPPIDYQAVVSAADRLETDRKIDPRRKPVELLAFTGVRPGMKVLDMATGGGYSTELLARAVGPTGVVYAQDSPNGPPGGRKNYEARAQRPVMKNVVRMLRPYDDPVPAQVRDLDLITFFFEYHEMERARIDRAKMNRRLYELLKPGGLLVVADHSARPGAGFSDGASLHRVEESVVRRDMEAAGFRLVEEGHFLRSAADTRGITVFKNPVPNDEFFLKYRKPR